MVSNMLEGQSQNILDLANDKPRKAIALNIGTYALQGIILGIAMGLLASLLTSHLPKFWTYVANTLSVMVFRIILQWIWVLGVTNWAIKQATKFFNRKTGREVAPEDLKKKEETSQVNTIITPAVTALALATILSTETVKPEWLEKTWVITIASAIGCALASVMEALCLPTNIYALRWNRHRYQETKLFQRLRNARGGNQNRSRK